MIEPDRLVLELTADDTERLEARWNGCEARHAQCHDCFTGATYVLRPRSSDRETEWGDAGSGLVRGDVGHLQRVKQIGSITARKAETAVGAEVMRVADLKSLDWFR